MNCAGDRPFCSRIPWVIAAGWLIVALFVGETELLTIIPGPAIPAIPLTLTVGLLAAYASLENFRRWVDTINTRSLVALHLTRFIGIYFLYLHAHGDLPGEFAIPAGWGDISVAASAGALLALPSAAQSRKALLAWNAAGLIDILLVVKTAAALVIANPNSLAPMLHLPLSFLPTMIVPLIIASHIFIFIRLFRRKPAVVAAPVQALLFNDAPPKS